MRAVYTETESICVYTETKNQGYYIYIIVALENLYVFILKQKTRATIYIL